MKNKVIELWKNLTRWKRWGIIAFLIPLLFAIIVIGSTQPIVSDFGNFRCNWGHEAYTCSFLGLFFNILWWTLIFEIIIGVPLFLLGLIIIFIISIIKINKKE